MSRRLKQWGELSRKGRGWGQKEYIYNGPKLPGWDGVHISVPDYCKQWKRAMLYVWINGKLVHKELVRPRSFLATYYTLRQEGIPDNVNVKILLEQL